MIVRRVVGCQGAPLRHRVSELINSTRTGLHTWAYMSMAQKSQWVRSNWCIYDSRSPSAGSISHCKSSDLQGG